MRESLHILVLAYLYPPDAGSGTYRTLYFMNNLSSLGYKISVITAKIEDFQTDVLVDNELAKKIHPNIQVIRCSVKRPLNYLINIRNAVFKNSNIKPELENSTPKQIDNNALSATSSFTVIIKDIISDFLTCPDQNAGWIPDVLRKGKHLIKHDKIDCIFATGGPWSCVLAGSLLHNITGVPLILDFQDPWASNPNLLKRSSLFRYVVKKMEAYVIKRASAVIANTNESRIDFIKKYTLLNEATIDAITNGYDEIKHNVPSLNKGYLTLVHTGELYLSRNPANLLEAIELLIKEGVVDKDHFRIKFVGGMSIVDSKLSTLLKSKYLENVVEFISRVSYSEALSYQLSADVLLLIQPDFPLQIPGKLYEYISILKPIFAITEESSATGNIIRDNNLGVVVDNRTLAIKDAVLELYQRWTKNQLPSLDSKNTANFSYEALTQKLVNIINATVGK